VNLLVFAIEEEEFHFIFLPENQLTIVAEPDGISPELRQASHRLTGGTHHEDTPALPLGPKSDPLSIGRKGGVKSQNKALRPMFQLDGRSFRYIVIIIRTIMI
jgi:hypothetical protein